MNKSFLLIASILLLIGCGSNKPITVTDVEGNSYNAVTIGTQVWMTENLKTTKYNDGTPIPEVSADSTWKSLSTGAYSWFNNDIAMKDSHGGLYNWYAVSSTKLCPTGWHVPSDKEWRILTDFLGDETIAGAHMKADSGWKNGKGDNSSGFSGLPYGFRSAGGSFSSHGLAAYFWSSSQGNIAGWYCVLFSKDNTAYKYSAGKQSGFSIRCVQNGK